MRIFDNDSPKVPAPHTHYSIRIIAEYLASIGVEIDEVNQEERFSHDNIHAVWLTALNKTKDYDLGLHAGIWITNTISGHTLGAMAANSPTIGEALDNLCLYHETCSDGPHPQLVYEGDHASVIVDKFPATGEVARQLVDCMFAAILTSIKRLSKQNIWPIEVRFCYSMPDKNLEHRKLFGTQPTYASNKNVLRFSLADLHKRIPYADAALLESLVVHSQKQLAKIKSGRSWSDKVERTLLTLVADKPCDITTVAFELCLSPRALQEKLKKEETSFQLILNRIKKNIAVDYLADNDITISQLALLLGYSEQSAFNHAFKRWTGKTPRQWRKENG